MHLKPLFLSGERPSLPGVLLLRAWSCAQARTWTQFITTRSSTRTSVSVSTSLRSLLREAYYSFDGPTGVCHCEAAEVPRHSAVQPGLLQISHAAQKRRDVALKVGMRHQGSWGFISGSVGCHGVARPGERAPFSVGTSHFDLHQGGPSPRHPVDRPVLGFGLLPGHTPWVNRLSEVEDGAANPNPNRPPTHSRGADRKS